MKLSLFDYNLPRGLIAQSPLKPRDRSRLLVYDKKSSRIKHDHFYNINKYLQAGDILVLNDTKVFPARLCGKKELTAPRQVRGAFGGGKIEVFLLKPLKGRVWEVLIGGKVRRIGQLISFAKGLRCEAIKKQVDGIWQVRFNKTPAQVLSLANQIGTTPTPPYVKKLAKLSDYQTVYAKKVGSVAAPTAGFHFTKRLLARLKKQGINFEFVTLHVGFGTFQPVKVNDIKKHKMHAEYAEVDAKTVQRLLKAKKEGRRIIAVGTTAVRVLETVFNTARPKDLAYLMTGFHGWINTFIYPGYKFKMVDAMITNFHLPKSTLLMLVSAFVGRLNILKIYKTAVRKKYRFFSFGDGMFIS